MECNYVYTRGYFRGTRCGKIGCSHPNVDRYVIVNINPWIMLDIFKNVSKQYLSYKKMYKVHGKHTTTIYYNQYNKWLHVYMYFLSNMGHVSYDIFTLLIYYYVDTR